MLSEADNIVNFNKMGEPRKEVMRLYLANIGIGETIIYEGCYKWRSLQTIARTMKRDFGCNFKFRTAASSKRRTITRER